MDSELSESIKIAIDNLKSFPNVEALNGIEVSENKVTVSVQWRVTLPSCYVSKGETKLGIRAKENVVWCFPLDFPFSAPEPTLRVDFPLDLPHINPVIPGERVSPCITETPILELLHSAGINSLLNALDHWLTNAASGELMCPIQGWEPVRYDKTTGIVYLDTGKVHSDLSESNKPARYFNYRYTINQDNDFLLGILSTPSLGSSNRSLKTKMIGVRGYITYSTALLLQTDAEMVCDKYSPIKIESYGDLRKMAAEYNLKSALDARAKFILSTAGPNACISQSKQSIDEFLVIFAVRRPFPLIGSRAPWELIGFRVSFNTEKGMPEISEHNTVQPIKLMEQASPEMLRAVSGTNNNVCSNLAILGCGSLGSKITLHLAKGGNHIFQLIDNDYFSSHNNARHGIIASAIDATCGSKVRLLQAELEKLNVQSSVKQEDILNLAQKKPCLANKNTDFIIDTTAALSVRHLLSQARELNGRLIHTVLHGNADMGVVFMEGVGRSVRLDDASAFLDALCISDNKYQASMYDQEVSRQVYGEGCSSYTRTLCDTDLSLMSASITKQINKLILHADSIEDGVLKIGLADLDGNLSWKTFNMSPTYLIPRNTFFEWDIRILGHVHNEIIRQSESDLELEQGGLLAGRVCELSKTIYVSKLIAAPKTTHQSKARISFSTEGLSEIFDEIHQVTNGQVTFLGTWHSHTSAAPPSGTDKETLKQLTNHYDLPIVMLVYTGGRAIRVDAS